MRSRGPHLCLMMNALIRKWRNTHNFKGWRWILDEASALHPKIGGSTLNEVLLRLHLRYVVMISAYCKRVQCLEGNKMLSLQQHEIRGNALNCTGLGETH